MEERKSLKQMIKFCDNDESCKKFQKQMEDINEFISMECSEDNYKKIKDNFEQLSINQDSLNTTGMWSLLKKLFPKNTPPPPVAKLDIALTL